jgi:dipeptidyl aminopeptidase/acylaminoacyl peptidase
MVNLFDTVELICLPEKNKMKKFLFCIVLLLYHTFAFTQKPALDFESCQTFPSIGERKISNDGKYVLFSVEGQTTRLYLRSVNNSYQKEFVVSSPYGARFTEDSHWMIFPKSSDSLCLFNLNSKQEKFVTNFSSFTIPAEGNGKWVAYQRINREVILHNLSNGDKKRFANAAGYLMSNFGKILLVNSKSGAEGYRLLWINLTNGKTDTIWQGNQNSSYTFDATEKKLAFVSEDTTKDRGENNIWYYTEGTPRAVLLVNNHAEGFTQGMTIANSGLKFSPKADKLFFNVYPESAASPVKEGKTASVDVWNYKDQYIQDKQLDKLEYPAQPMLSVINLGENKIIQLKKGGDAYQHFFNEGGNDDFLLVTAAALWEGYSVESWNLCIVNTKNGSRSCWNSTAFCINFSPGGKYVLRYDLEKKAYFSINLKTGITKNISEEIQVPLYDEQWDMTAAPSPYSSTPPVWTENDESVLIYDRYDIWKIDPSGAAPAVNITNGYGRKNKIILRCINYITGGDNTHVIKKDADIILAAFNELNKDNGFYSVNLKGKEDPRRLIMAPNVFHFPEMLGNVQFPSLLLKAKNAEVYLLTRESATEFPNLTVTKDFKNFTQISDLAPQKKSNWLTSELIHYNTFDGAPGTGILYKPENFNISRKYPIIFYFYERLSDELNHFVTPGLSQGPMNISYFISNGYLVFCPDIHYTIGKTGESVYNYVVSAAIMMSEKPFVDKQRMGLQGHSFGGYEVNYLITKTDIFSAASSAAGVSDMISNALDEYAAGCAGPQFTETRQNRMGTSMWNNQMSYISNSPIFYANQVKTPLLMMHCKRDGAVPWSQSVKLFTALRRLRKPVWMMQYDNGQHVLIRDEDKLDYSNRLVQFFDHYLKNQQPPMWMTTGVPAAMKGKETGYEFDLVGKCWSDCSICNQRSK